MFYLLCLPIIGDVQPHGRLRWLQQQWALQALRSVLLRCRDPPDALPQDAGGLLSDRDARQSAATARLPRRWPSTVASVAPITPRPRSAGPTTASRATTAALQLHDQRGATRLQLQWAALTLRAAAYFSSNGRLIITFHQKTGVIWVNLAEKSGHVCNWQRPLPCQPRCVSFFFKCDFHWRNAALPPCFVHFH